MKLPQRCECGVITDIDMSNMESRPLSKVVFIEGYTCPSCGEWKPLFVNSVPLQEKLERLASLRPGSKKLRYEFTKLLNRAIRLQEKHGSFFTQNLAIPGQMG